MKSKASYFNISPALVLENLRRFWTVGVLGFLIYFLSGPLPVLMNYNSLNNVSSYIQTSLQNMQPFFLMAHVTIPILAAVVLFKYLHNTASVTTLHTMPFTRSELYISHIVSGAILVTLPILANGVIYHIIQKPVYEPHMYKDPSSMAELLPHAVNMFTHSAINNWMLSSIIIVGTVYALSVLAGVLTGNIFLHLALAACLNVLAIAFYGTLMLYFNTFFYGFYSGGAHETIMLAMNPISNLMSNNGYYSAVPMLIYIGLIIFCLVASWVLYQKRSMEKAGESIVFKFMVHVLNYILTYFGMTLMGFYFASFLAPMTGDGSVNMPYFCLGLVVGAVITFIIGRMIVLGTPKIFNMSTVKSFGVYAIVAVVFVSTIIFDITGFESKIPAGAVDNVKVYSFELFNDDGLSTIVTFGKNIDPFVDKGYQDRHSGYFIFKDPENIELIRELHRHLASSEANYRQHLLRGEESYTLQFDYDISNPLGLQRSYSLSYQDAISNKYLKKLYESKEVKDYFSLDNFRAEEFTSIAFDNVLINSGDTSDLTSVVVRDKDQLQALMEAMEKDHQDRTLEEKLDIRLPYCYAELYYKTKGDEGKLYDTSLHFNIRPSDTHTIAWIEENLDAPLLTCTADYIESIEVLKYVDGMILGSEDEVIDIKEFEDQTTGEIISSYGYASDLPTHEKVDVTDEETITYILEHANIKTLNYNNYYECIVRFKPINNGYYEVIGLEETILLELDQMPKHIAEQFSR